MYMIVDGRLQIIGLLAIFTPASSIETFSDV